MNAQIHITRLRDDGAQTISKASAKLNGSQKLSFVTLEPSWVLNEHNISCIPCGTYKVQKRTTSKFGNHFHVLEVPDRSYILLHSLNFFNQTEGCIGVGKNFSLLNGDARMDITSSRATLDKLYGLMPDELTLTIEQHPEFQNIFLQGQLGE